MKNENVNNVLKGLLPDKIILKLIMLLVFLTILTSAVAQLQHPAWYTGHVPALFWRDIEEYDPNPLSNSRRNISPRLTGSNKQVKNDGNSPGESRYYKPSNDLEKTEESVRLGLPVLTSLESDTSPSNFKPKEDIPPDFNPEKIGRNFDTPYSSHINSKVGYGNSGDFEKSLKTQESSSPFVSDLGYFRPYRNQTFREIDNPDFRIVNSKGGGAGGRGRRPPPVSKRPTSSVLKPVGGDKVVFPDRYKARKFLPTLSKCSNKKDTLCESFEEGYPTEHISEVLQKEGTPFKEFFGKDRNELDIAKRINAVEESSLCPSRHEVIFPKAAKNTENKWLFIINQDKYIQGISVEICIRPNTSCDFTEGFPSGYNPYCKQRYIERRLIALGEEGKAVSDSFWIPSCCVCVLNNSAMLPKKK